jgi:hypothetical protein
MIPKTHTTHKSDMNGVVDSVYFVMASQTNNPSDIRPIMNSHLGRRSQRMTVTILIAPVMICGMENQPPSNGPSIPVIKSINVESINA